MPKGDEKGQNNNKNHPAAQANALLPSSAKRVVLTTMLCLLMFCTSSMALAFDFDWRSFTTNNTASLWPQAPAALHFPAAGTGLTDRQYCRLLAYNGIGSQIVRETILTAALADKSMPNSRSWLSAALQQRNMTLPAVADISRDTTCSLALLLASATSDSPEQMLRNIEFERLAKCGALPAWLWSVRENCVKLAPETLAEILRLIHPDDRVLVYSLAAEFPETYSDIILKGIREGEPIHRALAFLALSHLPGEKLPKNLVEPLRELLGSGDNWAIMLTALAYHRLKEPVSARLFEGFIVHSDPAVAACAAIAVGANGSLMQLNATLADSRIPAIVRGHLLVSAANRPEPQINGLIGTALASNEAVLRQLGAIAAGLRGEDVTRLTTLFQDIEYDVRATAAVGAGLSKGRSTFGILKSYIQDKHHEELSAVASSFLSASPSDATTRLLSGIPEYLFDRERGLALMSLGAASKEDFDLAAPQYRDAQSPYLRRLLAIGGLLSGDGMWLVDLDKAIGEFQDYRPFGDRISLRRASVALLVPDPFDYLIDFCFER